MKIALIVGEASGDKLGASLIDGFDAILEQPADFIGVAGPRMLARGMENLFPMQELSVMGIVEILKQYPRLKRRLNETAEYIIAQNPDVLITIDAPEFSLRLAKIIHAKTDIPIVHYVAPTVWAWRPKRADKMARFIDHVLALFPFEPALPPEPPLPLLPRPPRPPVPPLPTLPFPFAWKRPRPPAPPLPKPDLFPSGLPIFPLGAVA